MKILIVENEALIAEDIKDILEGAGHEVCGIAQSIREACKLAKSKQPDVAFLDVDLGNGESGLDVSERLASDYGIPSIFLTDRSDFRVRIMALNAQPLGFISKPYHPEDILDALTQAHI